MSHSGLGTRTAVACFVAGIGLLTFADAAWAHAIGVLCLLGFLVAAFLAIVPGALADPATNPLADTTARFSPARTRHPGDRGSEGTR